MENTSGKFNIFYKKYDIMNTGRKIPEPPALGSNLHRERRRQQLSLDALAAASGVSKAMLSQIEADKVNPTIATMWKIAHALNIDFETLLRGEGKRSKRFEVNRRENITSIAAESGAVFEVLSPVNMAEDLELYRLKLTPGCVHRSLAHSPGTEEFLTVLSGSIRVKAGENEAELRVGDFILFESDVEHEIGNPGDVPAEVYMVVRFAAGPAGGKK